MSTSYGNGNNWRSSRKVLLEQSDYGYDLGSVSSKRRRLLSDSLKCNFSNYTQEKIWGGAEAGTHTEDYDYKIFLNILSEAGDVEFEDIDAASEDDDVDPDYKIFLANLTEDGKSYVFEMKSENGTTVHVNYGEDDGLSDEIDIDVHKRSGVNISGQRRKHSVVEKNVNLKTSNPVSQNTYQCSSQKTHPNAFNPFYHDGKYPMDPSMIDESYYLFLNNVRMDGASLTLVFGDAVVKYDEDSKTQNNSDGSVTESASTCSDRKFTPHTTQKPFVSPMDEDGGDHITVVTGRDSFKFKEKLMADLRRPFNENEYKMLWRELAIEKPMERQRNLRGRSVSYATGQMSRSYLKHFPELEKQLQENWENPYKALNLLRGFFFWLKYCSHEGALMPWSEPFYSEIMDINPGHSHKIGRLLRPKVWRT